MMVIRLALVLSVIYVAVYAEVFTSMEHTRELVKTEEAMLDVLRTVIKAEEKKLETLKALAEDLERQHSVITAESLDVISAYKLIRRLEKEWKIPVSLITDQTNIEEAKFQFDKIKNELRNAVEEDVLGAAGAIVRLQEFYLLNTSAVARGELTTYNSTSGLSAAECFDIGWYCHDQFNYRLMREWMTEALNRYTTEVRNGRHKKGEAKQLDWDIYEYLPRAIFMDGDVELALKVANDILEIYPNHESSIHYRTLFNRVIQNRRGSSENEKLPDPLSIG